MKDLKKLLRNIMAVALVVAITVPNSFCVFADSEEENTTETENTVQAQTTPEAEVASEGDNYTDGSYSGNGKGRNGDITVTININDGKISNVEAEQQETPTFWDKAKVLIDNIKNMGNPSANDIDGLDAVTSATLSSNGIKEAMKDALSKALGNETIFAGGEGTSKSPYIISNEVQLQNFSKSVNSGEEYADKYIKFSDDIDVSGIAWIPIGSEEHPFGGIFDGNGKSVKNITIGEINDFAAINEAGFFGKLSDGAAISNLTIDNANIYITGVSGSKVYGAGLIAISGKNNSIDRCSVINSDINVKSNSQQFVYAAGLVGYFDQNSSVINSVADCDVKGEGDSSVYAGGIAALTGNKTLIMNNYTEGKAEAEVISGGKNTATAISGGVVGMASGVMYNCYAENKVGATNNTTSEKVKAGSLTAWSTGNGCVLNSCYNSNTNDIQPVIIYPEATTFSEGITDIKDKNAQEVVQILHNNLAQDKIDAAKNLMAEKSPAKDFGFEGNLIGKNFYDWEEAGATAKISQNIWKEIINPESVFASGTGSKEDPYILQTEDQIRKFAVSLSNENTYAGKFIKLSNDIEVSADNWTPIGEGEYPFCGIFDGDGHDIEGITIIGENGKAFDAGKDVYFGLFGVIGKNGTVRNLGVTNTDINVSGKASAVVGGICGLNNQGTIDSCFVTGNLKGQTIEKGNNYVGGVVGWAVKGYIVNSYANATVYSSVLPTALAMPGGIAGMTNRAVVANCYSLGTVTGHTKRELEVVESMAAVGGLTGVAGAPVVNCYTNCDTISEDYSFYVGAAIGWATGIAEIYDVYYNAEAAQTIQNEKISPIADIGWKVKQGINEEGEVYSGALTYDVEGKTSQDIKSQALADKLNSNFNSFPLNNDKLPENIKLKKWTVKDGIVTFSDEYADRTYVEPPVEKPVLTGNYYDGTFYGRAEKGNEYLNVTIEVKNKTIVSIESNLKNDEINSIIENVLKTNQAPEINEKDNTDVKSFKNALRRATVKALKGDYADYSLVNNEIFEGGDGSKEDPYRISTAEQLVKFAAAINEVEHFKDKYIVLTSDIDLLGIQWVPAGGSGLYAFSGNFDGKGHKITNMKIGSENEAAKYTCAGLFAHINTATVQNLEVKDGYINIEPASIPSVEKERTYAGLIAGYAGITSTDGTRGVVIDNCYVTGHIVSNSVEHNYVGGLAGLTAHSLISNSCSNCEIDVKSPGNWVYVGGLVGLPSFSVIVNNYAYGKIHSDAAVNKTQLGGIGGMYSSYGFNNYTDVDLNSERQTADIGGIAGRNTGIGYISNCYGNITTEQKSGNKITTGVNAVGTLVNGDKYGKGQIGKSELAASINQSFANVLNQNIGLLKNDKMYTELVRDWNIYVPENLKFNTWTIKDGNAVFGIAQNNDNNNGGGSSHHSGGKSSRGSSATSNKNEESVSYKVKATVSQGGANAEIKVSDIKESKNLQIESSVGNIIFDEKALKAILTKAGTEVSAKINTIEKSSLSKELQNVIGERPVYDISLISGGKTISDFGSGTVSVEIPYTLCEGEKSEGIVVYYMDDSGKLTKMKTSYNEKTKKVTFVTNHFSKYIVGYDSSLVQNNFPQARFTDVAENAWYANAVKYALENSIMNGISDTKFEPDTNTTRAMVCTIFWNMEKKPAMDGNSKFADVANDSWYTKSVIWAAQNGVAKGVSESTFEPNAKVTREQFAQFLYAYAKYKGYNVTKTNNLSAYKDRPSAWAEEAVKWAVGNELMNGKGNGTLDPQGTATRAEIAQMIMKFKLVNKS